METKELVRVSPEELGNRIRGRRNYLDLSQAELGAMLGVKGPQISRIEAGKRSMTVAFFGRLCAALKTTEGTLLYDPPIPGYLNPAVRVSQAA